VTVLLATISSPHSGVFHVFGRPIHLYGLMLLLAIVACIWLTWVRWKRMGGDPDLVLRVAVWGVAAGIIGARAYHDITSWDQVPKEWWGPFAVWRGGLGVWGGILLGCLVGAWIVHRAGASVARFADEVGDEVDRARRDHGRPELPGPLDRGGRLGHRLGRRTSELLGQGLERSR